MRDKTGQINHLTGKYIIELSNLKHLKLYMTSYELEYMRFELRPQSNKLSLTFTPKMEELFLTLETSDIDMNIYRSTIETIVNRNFGNTFQNQNGPNHSQHTHKNTSQQCQHRNTRQQ